VIPAVHPRGTNVGGLLRYLFGPGKREEHVNPRLVAAWDGAGPLTRLEPPTRGDGRRDVRRLTELLEQPVASGWNPPAKTVWHCSIRNHPTDRYLSDQQWAHIAGEVMAAVGLAPHDDPAAVRWVAVRHGDDHIHLVATLVRQDRRTAWAWKDKLHAQQACRDLEERYNLYRVAPPGAGSRTWPRPAELNKAARLGGTDRRGRPQTPRDRLRHQVRAAAMAAINEADFLARLRHAGVQVRLRYSKRDPGQVTGYAVAMAGHTTPAGTPIWYGGGRLALDLTLPRLRTRWRQAPKQPTPPTTAQLAGVAFPPLGLYRRAAEAASQAATAMSTATDPAVAGGIASAAADLLAATASVWERGQGGPLTDAADLFDRAAHDLRHRQGPARRIAQAMQLRSMARLITLMGVISGDEDAAAALRLLYTLAALAEHLADLRETQERIHQAQAARTAAAVLRTYLPPKGDAGPLPSSGISSPIAQREPVLRRAGTQRSR
jgi:MobA/VirD2-like, nuclease domain